ncbi:hypothetical protein SARC_12899 [Sphaeroforma arctica JP610]|uniref:Uncharacterized protein n=1 Tax=Sphaeroforma arctica JP610 TaxID=667725 RepID=A0A0L0FET1_9EUKA|nr:hypothetical protein SARC_12899 [Sphaeroforma arctica JP610]KNC74558.1 hypothetical protein SARC_12899 [Sphaeroforma arctica JP610]|eukprot:XP_014148460.1 hypothetical protein SARC_12899 [Sphaeroforma arctica JP610]
MPTDNSGTYGSMAIVGDYHTNKGLTSETGTGQLSRSCDATGGRGATLDTPNPGLSAGRLNAANCGQSNSRSSMVGTNKNAGMRDANHRLTPVFLVQPTEDNETVEAFVDSGGIKTVEGHGTKAHPHICTNTLTHAPERSRTGANAAERSRTSANAPSRTHTHLRTHTHTHTRSRSHELTSVTIAPTRIRPSTPTKGSQSGEVTEVFKSRIYFKNKTAQYQDAKTPWQKRDILSHSGSLSSTVRNAPLRRTLTPLFCR